MRYLTPFSFLLYSIIGVLVGFMGTFTTPSDDARIQLTQDDATLLVTGLYSTEQPPSDMLSYTLRLVREGAGGRSASTQSGSFEVTAGTVQTLATSRVNAGDGDTLQIDLHIRNGSAVVAHEAIRCTVPICPLTDSTD
jgi:hypothetical protein